MSASWTEERIRQFLDCTFTKVTYEGKVVVEAVDPDFLPPAAGGGRPHGTKNTKPHAYWSQADDELLQQMRLRNKPIAEIAWILNRTPEATKKRAAVLRVRGWL